MASWNPTQPLPRQVADAFAAMYDWFDTGDHVNLTRQGGFAERLNADHDVTTLKNAVRATSWETPPELEACIAAVHDASWSEQCFAVFACLRAIDDGFAPLHPARAPHSFSRLWSHYEQTGFYNDASEGYVLPAWALPGLGAPLSRCFTTLVRSKVDRATARIVPRRNHQKGLPFDRAPRVAAVPFLYRLQHPASHGEPDLQIEPVNRGDGRFFFKVNHLNNHSIDLNLRVRQAVDAIRDEGVEIAIFPELALSPDLVVELQQALLSTAAPKSPLVWVIVGHVEPCTQDEPIGTDDFLDYNAAVVLDSYGQVVGANPGFDDLGWRQRKRHPYTLDLTQQSRYGVTDLMPPPAPREEAMKLGSLVTIFEEGRGRAAVLICEDFARTLGTCDQLVNMGCSHLFVLVMDGPIDKTRWAPGKARAFEGDTGSIVTVVNSLALPTLPAQLDYAERKANPKNPRIPAPMPDRLDVAYVVRPYVDNAGIFDVDVLDASTTPKTARDFLSGSILLERT